MTTKRIVFAGDSITAANIYGGLTDPILGGPVTGYAPKTIASLPSRYPAFSFTCWNEGVNGTKTTDWTGWVGSKITTHAPDIVTLMLGTNDAAQDVGISLAAFETNLRSIINSIFAYNPAIKIVLLTPPPVYEGKPTSTRTNAVTTNYAQRVRDIAASIGGNVILGETWNPIIAHAGDANYPDWWYPTDGIHPMQMGHNTIYDAVDSAINGILNPAGASVTGNHSATLASIVTTEQGGIRVAGASTVALGAIGRMGQATNRVGGNSTRALATITPNATGSARTNGTQTVTLADVTPSAQAVLPITGAAALSLDPVRQAAAGRGPRSALQFAAALAIRTITDDGAVIDYGTTEVNPLYFLVQPFVQVISDDGGIIGYATDADILTAGHQESLLEGVASDAAAVVLVSGAEVATLAPITTTATGVVVNASAHGALTTTLEGIAAEAQGALAIAGEQARILADMIGADQGTVGVTGSVDTILDAIASTAAGAVVEIIILGAHDALFADIAADCHGSLPIIGESSVVFGFVVAPLPAAVRKGDIIRLSREHRIVRLPPEPLVPALVEERRIERLAA
jgi:lysophospholipase L1-like esterase